MKLTRKQKILRNIFLCLLVILATYAALDFPPYTVSAMCRRVQVNEMLEELEPVYVLREKHSYSGEIFNRRYTYIIARSGDAYMAFLYDRHLLSNELDKSRIDELRKGGLCTARKGMIYIAGDFTDIVSATVEVLAERGAKSRTFAFEGQRLAENLFAFDANNGEPYFPFGREDVPEEEMSLCDIARFWFRTSTGGGGYSLDHVELPVTLTLYGENGSVLDVRKYTIGTYDLHTWF